MKEMDLINDVALLTTIPKNYLDKLIEKSIWCICDELQDSKLQEDLDTKINIGIGYLIISDCEDQIKYKFIPGLKLEESVRDTLVNKNNPLQLILEKTLVNHIIKTYKDII